MSDDTTDPVAATDPILAAFEADDPDYFLANEGLLYDGSTGEGYFLLPRAVSLAAWDVLNYVFRQTRTHFEDLQSVTRVNYHILTAPPGLSQEHVEEHSHFSSVIPLACFIEQLPETTHFWIDPVTLKEIRVPSTITP